MCIDCDRCDCCGFLICALDVIVTPAFVMKAYMRFSGFQTSRLSILSGNVPMAFWVWTLNCLIYSSSPPLG